MHLYRSQKNNQLHHIVIFFWLSHFFFKKKNPRTTYNLCATSIIFIRRNFALLLHLPLTSHSSRFVFSFRNVTLQINQLQNFCFWGNCKIFVDIEFPEYIIFGENSCALTKLTLENVSLIMVVADLIIYKELQFFPMSLCLPFLSAGALSWQLVNQEW